MSEPYRASGYPCPTCPNASLREYQGRLVCDECHGLFMAEEDFVTACADLAGQHLTLAFTKDEATTRTCPRCDRTLVDSQLTLEPTRAKASVLRCTQHGMWCSQRVLMNVFAKMGRGSLNRAGGGLAPITPAGFDTRGLDGLPVARGGSASAGLRISEWRARPRKRASTLTTVNVYADKQLVCPTCTDRNLVFMGDRYLCGQCGGTFVQNAVVEDMILDVAHEQFQLPPVTGTPGTRLCPVCTKPLVVENLERVPIDRCDAHGVWFDPNELTVTLEQASGQFEPRGVRAWLERLFT